MEHNFRNSRLAKCHCRGVRGNNGQIQQRTSDGKCRLATDLVTDLPADFEVFGQAVDTDFVDLLGGTTGQVLSKTSATDMAFTWIDQDDSNAIQNAIVDAKGDLIGATAADTPSRLAVGTDGQILTADSTEATGLKWAVAQ
jgi:hypothetical protein